MIEVVALYLAGLSFFFTGVAGISENLRQMSGQRFRLLLARATNHPVRAGLLGVALGVMTQSTSVVAFILSGMIATGLLPLGRALIVLAASNLGTALLVFIAAMDLHLPILFLIGVSGLLIAFKLLLKWKPGMAVVLSVGLVFFGLDMMKQAFKPFSSSPGMTDVGKFFDYWPDAAFFLGMLMRTVIHSSSAVAAITITISPTGMMGEFPSMMAMAGLGMGTAVATYLLSSNLRGVPRQIALYQAVTNVAAGLLMAVLLLVEHMGHVPLLMAGLHHLSASEPGRLAAMYFAFNGVLMLVSIVPLRWAPEWLARMSPPTPEEHLSRPMYLQAEALLSPETALDLVALEQLRVVRALGQYLSTARGEGTVELQALHAAAGELSLEITAFLQALVNLPIARDLAARVISFQRKEETLRSLEENVFLFAETLAGRHHAAELAGRLVEALDTIVLTALDALESKTAMDVEMVVRLTDDRGGMMERLRNQHRLDETAEVADVSAVHYATTLFERNVWLLRQLALWMREDGRVEAA